MRKTYLANAKARHSELVDAAEHRGGRILSPARARSAAPEKSVARFVSEFSSADPEASAVEDLQQSRR